MKYSASSRIVIFLSFCFLAFSGFIFSPAPLAAHPHMFFDTELTVRTNSECMEGFTVAWYFDKAFSASIVMDFDKDNDGLFNTTETEEVYNNAFTNLRNYDFFYIHHI